MIRLFEILLNILTFGGLLTALYIRVSMGPGHSSSGLSDSGHISLSPRDIRRRPHRPPSPVGCDHHRPEPWVVEGDRRRGGGVEEVERHAIPPDGRSALDDERAAGDLRQGRQRLGRGDGGGDSDGVDDGSGHQSSLNDCSEIICLSWSTRSGRWTVRTSQTRSCFIAP